jgi:hypothetical protein
MPSESLSVCSVCGRPIPPKDYNGTGEGVCLVTDGRRCREAAITARLTAERRLAEALEALREVPCANRTREVGNPDDECNDERGYCARCRVLTGTPPVPAPVNHSAIPNSSAAPVADIVLEGEDAAAFAELHRNPPAPTPGLVRAMRRHAEAVPAPVSRDAVLLDWHEARLTEGQAAKRLGVDRVAAREMQDEWRAKREAADAARRDAVLEEAVRDLSFLDAALKRGHKEGYVADLRKWLERASDSALAICRAWHGSTFGWPGHGGSDFVCGELARAEKAVLAVRLLKTKEPA